MKNPSEFPLKSRFTIKESAPAPQKFESGVPRALTIELLKNLPVSERSSFDSGIVEDFLISALKDGLSVSEIGERAKASSLETDIVQIQERAVSEELKFTINEMTKDAFVDQVKAGIVEVMKSLGATDTQIEAFKQVIVNFEQVPGTSTAGSTIVVVNIPQVLRKVFDAIQGLGIDESDLPNVIKIIMKRTIAHELGHAVDKIMDTVSNIVERDEQWGNPDKGTEENQAERFAEFIGLSQLDTSEAEFSQKERLLNIAKSSELWEAIKEYNANQSQKVGIGELLTIVENTFDTASARAFVTSRQYLYGSARPENYAMPYTLEQIQKAGHAKLT